MLGIEDPYTAFCLDQAVAYFGNTIHAEMDSVEGNSTEETNRKRRAILTKYLSRDDKPLTHQFADPALMFQ